MIISPDQQWLASGGQGQVTIRRFSDGAVVQVLKGREGADHLVAFSPDSRYLAVAANTSSGSILVGAPTFPAWEPVTLYRVADGRQVQSFQGHNEGAYGLAYSPTGDYLATFGASTDDRTLRLWRVSPHHPFEPFFWLGGGLTLLLVAVGRWIWQRRVPRS